MSSSQDCSINNQACWINKDNIPDVVTFAWNEDNITSAQFLGDGYQNYSEFTFVIKGVDNGYSIYKSANDRFGINTDFQYLNSGQFADFGFNFAVYDKFGDYIKDVRANIRIQGLDEGTVGGGDGNSSLKAYDVVFTGQIEEVWGQLKADGNVKNFVLVKENIVNGADQNAGTNANLEQGGWVFRATNPTWDSLGDSQEKIYTMKYYVTDENGNKSNTATIQYQVIGRNDAPDAKDDAAAIERGTVLTYDAISAGKLTDVDSPVSQLSIENIYQLRIDGQVISNAVTIANYVSIVNNKIVFDSSKLDMNGAASRVVEVCWRATDNNTGHSGKAYDEAILKITVNAPTKPTANNVSYTDDEEGTGADTIAGELAGFKFALNVSNPANLPLTYNMPTTVTINDGKNDHVVRIINNNDGTFSLNREDFQWMSYQMTRDVVFNYTVNSSAGSSTAQAKVNIFGWNDFPEDGDEALGLVSGNQTVNLLANASDIDVNDVLSVRAIDSITVTIPGSIVKVFNIPSSVFSDYITVDANGIATIKTGAFGSYIPANTTAQIEINYTVRDTDGANNASKVTLNVKGAAIEIEAKPVNVVDNEDGTLPSNTGDTSNISFKLDISNPSGVPVTLMVGGSGVTPAGASNQYNIIGSDGNSYLMTLNTDGTFSFDKNAFQSKNIGQDVVFNFNYTISSSGVSSTAPVTATVLGLNDAPEDGDESYNVSVDSFPNNFVMNLLDNSSDIDNAKSSLTIKAITKVVINGVEYTDAASINKYVSNFSGQASLNTNQITIPQGGLAVVKVYYTIQDPHGATNDSVATINLTNPYNDIDAKNVSYTDNEDGTGVDENYGELAGFKFKFDVYNPNAGNITYSTPASVVIDGRVVKIINNNDGTFNLDAADLQWMNADMVRDVVFNYIATDSLTGKSDTAIAAVKIQGLNDAPIDGDEFLGVYEFSANNNPNYSIIHNFVSNASDIDSGDDVHVSDVTSIVVRNQNGDIIQTIQNLDILLANSSYINIDTANKVANILPSMFNVPAGQTYNVTINYTVTDRWGATDKSVTTLSLKNTDQQVTPNGFTYTDNEDGTGADTIQGELSGFKFALQISNPSNLYISSYNLPSSVVIDGRTVKIINNNDGTFNLDANDLQWMNPDMVRDVQFNYTVTTRYGVSSPATGKVVIQGLNDAPVDGDEDLGTIAHNSSSASYNLLTNTSDIDAGDVVTVKSIDSIVINGQTITGAAIANYVVVTNGVFATINPSAFNVPAGTTYPVTINYTVTDKYGATDTSKLTLNINNSNIPNNPPVVSDVIATDNEDGTLPTNINDTNNINFKLNATDANGDALTYKLTGTGVVSQNGSFYVLKGSDGNNYTATVDANGVVTFDKGQFQFMRPDSTPIVFNGINFTATDTKGAAASAVFKPTITGVNDAPVDGDEDLGTIAHNSSSASYNLLTNTSDIDAGDVVTVKSIDSIVINGQAITGAAIANYVVVTNGVFATINPSAFNVPAGTTYPVTINYTVTDKYGATDTSKLTLNINNSNIPNNPPVVSDVIATDNEDGTLPTNINDANNINFKLNASDANGDALTYKLTGAGVVSQNGSTYVLKGSDGNNYTATVDANGVVTFDKGQFQFMRPDSTPIVFNGINFTATDTKGAAASAVFRPTITGVNDAPIDGDEDLGTIAHNSSSASYNLLTNTSDIDAGDVVTVKSIDSIIINGQTITGAAIANYVVVTNGVFATINPSAFNVPAGTTYPVTINYTVTDKYGATDTSKLTLNINNSNIPNNPPVVSDVIATDNEDGTLPTNTNDANNITFKLTASDANGDALTYKLTGNGVVSQNGSFYVLKGSDGNNYTATVDANGVVTFDKAQFQSLNVDSTPIVFNNINFTATDTKGAAASAVFKPTITGVNDAPTDADEALGSVNENAADVQVNLLANASDIDNAVSTLKANILSVTVNGVNLTDPQISQLLVKNSEGVYTIKPGYFELSVGQEANVQINYEVVDPWGAKDNSIATIKVVGTNDIPTVTPAVFTDNEDGTQAQNDGIINFKLPTASDVDGTISSYSLTGANIAPVSGQPNTFTAVANNGQTYTFTFNPATGDINFGTGQFQSLPQGTSISFPFSYAATDNNGGVSIAATSTVVINGVNDAPVDGDENLGTIAYNAANQTVNLLANASDVDFGNVVSVKQIDSIVFNGQTITGANIANYVTVVNGVATINPAAFNVPANTTYPVTINYTVTDNFGATDTSKVTLSVNNGTQPPVPNAVTYTDNEDGTGVDEISGEQAGFKFAFNVSNPSGLALTYNTPASVTIDGRTVKIINNNDGTFSLDSNDLQWMSQGTTKDVVFNYTVTSSVGTSAPAVAKVVITGLNDAPTDGDEVLGTIAHNAANQTVNLLANASDPDAGDVVSVKQIDSIVFNGQTITGANISNYVTVVNGVATINTAAFNVPASTAYAVVINYTVQDTFGATDTSKVTLTVNNGTTPPTANPVTYTDTEDATGADTISGELPGFKFAFNVSNPSNLALTYSTPASVTIDGNVVKIINNNDGTFSLDTADLQWMSEGLIRDLSFNYTVTSSAGTTQALAKVVLTGINDAPVDADEAYGQVLTTAGNQTLNLVLNATDVDTGDSVSIKSIDSIVFNGQTITGANVANYITFVNGVATLNPAAFNVPANTTYAVTINYTVKDTFGATDSSVATISLKNPNRAPDAVDDNIGTVDISTGTPITIKPLLNDTDPDGDVVTVKTIDRIVITDKSGTVLLDSNVPGVIDDYFDLTNPNEPKLLTNKFNVPVDGQYTVDLYYTAKDPSGATDSAKITTVLVNPNKAPDAVNDGVFNVTEGTKYTIDVLTNDTTGGDNPDSVTIVPTGFTDLVIGGVPVPANQIPNYIKIVAGKVEFDASTLNANTGSPIDVSFKYTIVDQYGLTDTATVTLKVNDNGAPTVTPVDTSDNEDGLLNANNNDATGLTFKLTATDNAAPSDLTYKINAGAGVQDLGAGQYKLTGSDGNVYNATLKADGTVEFSTADFQKLNPTQQVVFNFGWTATDTANGQSSTTTAKFTVLGLNDAPTDGDEALGTIAHNAANQTINLLANTFDVDNNDEVNVQKIDSIVFNGQTITGANIANYVTLVNGLATINPAAFNVPAATSYPVTINYTVVDKYGATDTSKVTLTVNNGTTPPTANPVTYTDTEDATGADTISGELPGFKFAFNVSNPSNLALTYSTPASVTIDGNVVKIINNNDGTFSLDTADLQWMSEGLIRDLSFNYTVTSSAGTTQALAKVVLTGINDAPVDADEALGTIAHNGAAVNVNLLAAGTFSDVDAGDVVSVKAIDSIVFNGQTITGAANIANYVTIVNGVATINPAAFNVPANTSYPVTINYTVQDTFGATDTSKVTLTVNNANITPVAKDVAYTENEDANHPSEITGELGNNTYRLDVTNDGGNPLSYTLPATITVNGQSIRVVNNNNGTFTLNASDLQTKLNSMFEGQKVTTTFAYTVTDTVTGLTSTANIKLDVFGVNDAPDAIDDTASVNEGAPVVINVLANDTDPDTQDATNPLYVTKVTKIVVDANTTITDTTIINQLITYLNPTNGLGFGSIQYNAPNFPGLSAGQTKNIEIHYEARDKQGLTDTAIATVTVNGVNGIDIALDNNNVDISYVVKTQNAIADNNPITTSEITFNNTENYINDTKVGTTVDDKIIGDIRNFTVNVEAGDAIAKVQNTFSGNASADSNAAFVLNKLNFGNDTIDGNNGDDILVGDVDVLKLSAQQGDARAEIDYLTCGGNPVAFATANATITNNTFKFGNDVLRGGEGNDKIVGDVSTFDATYLSGSRVEIKTGEGSSIDYKFYGITNNTFTFGNDSIDGGKGDDLLVGDVEHIKYVDQQRTFTTDANGQLVEQLSAPVNLDFDVTNSTEFAKFVASDLYTKNTFNFGSDTFVFDAASGFGNDKIKDFKIDARVDPVTGVKTGFDQIQFVNLLDANNSGGKDFDDLRALTRVENDGTGHVKLLVDTNKDGSFESSITFLNKDFVTGQTDITNYFSATDFII